MSQRMNMLFVTDYSAVMKKYNINPIFIGEIYYIDCYFCNTRKTL